MDTKKDDKDYAIEVLARQRNELLNQITNLQITVSRLTDQLPKPEEQKNGDVGIS